MDKKKINGGLNLDTNNILLEDAVNGLPTTTQNKIEEKLLYQQLTEAAYWSFIISISPDGMMPCIFL